MRKADFIEKETGIVFNKDNLTETLGEVLEKNNKNWGKKKFDPTPHPLAPWGRFLGF